MQKNKFSNDAPEQVLLIPKPRRIEINYACANRAYGLFDTKTGTQVKDFVKGNGGQIEFNNLDPNMHYDVGILEGMEDDKPQFAINWIQYMCDETDTILSSSNDLPIEYPCAYDVIFDDNNSNGIFDMVDDEDVLVGQVVSLTHTDDKPEYYSMRTFRMKDDTIE